MTAPDRTGDFLSAAVESELRPDGSLLLASPVPLAHHEPDLGRYLSHWAQVRPQQTFLAERGADAAWSTLSFREAQEDACRIAAALLARNRDPERPLLFLSGNSLHLARMMLGAMLAGIPFAPISPAYSLVSRDYGKLRYIHDLLEPALIFVEDTAAFAPALAALSPSCEVVAGSAGGSHPATPVTELLRAPAPAQITPARPIGPDTVVKILFTSGSTGVPKGVINTHRMLCSNQQAIRQLWPFLLQRPPLIVDWLPWNHTFGGCHNFNLVLCNGGSLYIDAGRPLPGQMETSITNLKSAAPTLYFNVPAGFDALLPFLEQDLEFCRHFFSELDLIMYAAASLPQAIWDRLERLSLEVLGRKLPFISGWGTTETAPLATSTIRPTSRAGAIGLPIPGTSLKLVPHGDNYEIRVRGPNITPGYWRRPEVTAAAFDAEGYYLPGDLVSLADPDGPEQGILFKGRIAEDFKLDTGTWVAVGALRVAVIEACAPLVQDVIICGHDRREIGALLIPGRKACTDAFPDLESDWPDAVPGHRRLRARLAGMLEDYNRACPAGSTRIARVLLFTSPLSIDAGEITDKGYINQRGVLNNHAAEVERLYTMDPAVIMMQR